jgi:hypothetical protein
VNKVVLKQQADDGLRHHLQPGERIAASSAVSSDPSRWGVAVLLTVALGLTAAGLVSLLGPVPASPVLAVALPVLGLGIQFLPRPMYVAVTDRRLICSRVARLRGKPRRPAFAVPLTDLRILNYRSGKYGTSIRCEIPGRKPLLLHVGRAGRKDFAEVEMALARSGAFATLDPWYPSAENFSTAAYRH